MSEDKHLTWEQVVEGLYGFKPKKRVYSEEEMERYRKRLEEYTREKAAQRDKQKSESGSEEKKSLPPLKEYMELLYRKKLEEPQKHSEEEWNEFWRKVDEYNSQNPGPRGTS